MTGGCCPTPLPSPSPDRANRPPTARPGTARPQQGLTPGQVAAPVPSLSRRHGGNKKGRTGGHTEGLPPSRASERVALPAFPPGALLVVNRRLRRHPPGEEAGQLRRKRPPRGPGLSTTGTQCGRCWTNRAFRRTNWRGCAGYPRDISPN